MANRNQDYSSGSRGSQQNWRDDDDGRNEAEAGSRGGNYDQGRVQYGRREQNDQSGSTGRYAGYGDFGRGNYGGGRSGWSGQDRYGQSGYGEGDYGQSNSPEGYYGQGNFGQGSGQTSGSRGVFGQNDWRAGGFGDRTDNDRERSNYGRFGEGGGYGGAGGMGYSGGSGGQGYSGDYGYGGSGRSGYGQGNYRSEYGYGSGRGGGEQYGGQQSGQQYGQRGQYGSQAQQGRGMGQQGMGQHHGKGPKGYQRSDERIKELISERLREDPEIDPSEVTISVQGGKITLEGTVDSRQTKNAIEEIAEQFGSQDIQNNLRVQRAGQQSSDAMGQKGKTGTSGTGGSAEDQSGKVKQH